MLLESPSVFLFLLGGRFGYFLIFSARGGEGGVRGARKGAGSVFY